MLRERDLELLSAYLDDELSGRERARLQARLAQDEEWQQALRELQQIRAFLRQTPQRPPPHHFVLTSQSVGLRPPVPPLVPALRWVSALTTLLLLFSFLPLLFSLIPPGQPVGEISAEGDQLPFVAMAPAETPTSRLATLPTETPLAEALTLSLASSVPEDMEKPPSAYPTQVGSRPEKHSLGMVWWRLILAGLALSSGGVAYLMLQQSKRAFRRRLNR